MINRILERNICAGCALTIPEERLIVLPETRYCARCSPTQKVKGKNVFPHKTGSEVVVMSASEFEKLNRLDRRRTQQHRR